MFETQNSLYFRQFDEILSDYKIFLFVLPHTSPDYLQLVIFENIFENILALTFTYKIMNNGKRPKQTYI